VGAAIGKHCAAKGCDFVVLLGDNFYPSGVASTSDPQWQSAFVTPYESVNVPFYAVLGNHDYGADGMGTDLPRADAELAYGSVNPKWRMPAAHYRFRRGDVEFFVADTNRSMFALDQDARRDFETWLTESTAPWKIVFAHHPYKSNGRHGNAGNYDDLPFLPFANGANVKAFIEDRVCGRADVYMNGHDHHLEWIEATCTRPGSSIATQFLISGAGANTTTCDRTQPTWFKSNEPGFVSVVIEGRTFTATFFDGDGKQLFSRSVTK
jgi:predicted phosphodiesterase